MRTEALLLIATVSLLVTNACSKEMPEPQRGEEKVLRISTAMWVRWVI